MRFWEKTESPKQLDLTTKQGRLLYAITDLAESMKEDPKMGMMLGVLPFLQKICLSITSYQIDDMCAKVRSSLDWIEYGADWEDDIVGVEGDGGIDALSTGENYAVPSDLPIGVEGD